MLAFQIIVLLLFALAITDLIVGVSNDAVNFLNSAVGSKAASFRTILLIAGAGVLVGTLFSNGMMQIARNGIFQPEFFTFDKVMIIFLAVMLTDVILLDIYNSLGLPTSTTVSLIFELLGASFTVGVVYLLQQDKPLAELDNILNYRSAFIIIGGIFFSVLVAFVSGSVIHFFTRLLFTFNLKKTFKLFGPAFSGAAVTIIVYFLLIKGLEGSALLDEGQLNWVNSYTAWILVVSFIAIMLATLVLMRFTKIDPLKIVVLLGTFSLAMAFAGNDLVNFMGVSVAAYSSYSLWSTSGVDANSFSMDVLNQQISTPTWFLISAGAIMVLTLWFSAKSRNVTETEVSLGRQDEGDEKFTSNPVSRALVGGGVFLGAHLARVIPRNWKAEMTKRLSKPKEDRKNKKGDASFDLLRASVNLVVSSALIAFGTSQKLPLSTTFVTFMVAMGTSFADQAWGRESAVYRVSGVLQVIYGWVLTALVAFAGSSLVALFLYFTGFVGVAILATLTIGRLAYSQIAFKKKQKQENDTDVLIQKESITVRDLLAQSKLNTAANIKHLASLMSQCCESLLTENQHGLEAQKNQAKKIASENRRLSSKIIKYIRKTESGGLAAGRLNLLVFDLLQDLYQSGLLVSDVCFEHRINLHALPTGEFRETLKTLKEKMTIYLLQVKQEIQQLEFTQVEQAQQQYQKLAAYLSASLDSEVKRIQQDEISNRMATLQTRILLEMTDIIETTNRLYRLYLDFAKQERK